MHVCVGVCKCEMCQEAECATSSDKEKHGLLMFDVLCRQKKKIDEVYEMHREEQQALFPVSSHSNGENIAEAIISP